MSHNDLTDLITQLSQIKKTVKEGDKYFHYKFPDQSYHIIRVGIIEEIEKICVIYEAEYGEKIVWVRTLEDFQSKVITEDGTEVDRFTKVE